MRILDSVISSLNRLRPALHMMAPQIIIFVDARRFCRRDSSSRRISESSRPRNCRIFADKKRGRKTTRQARTEYADNAKPFRTLEGGRRGGEKKRWCAPEHTWQRAFISLKRRTRARARAKDGTLHPRGAIIPNYFSISVRRKERAA